MNNYKNLYEGESIARSTQIAIETDQIGNSVLNELNEQGEKLRNTNEMVVHFYLFWLRLFRKIN